MHHCAKGQRLMVISHPSLASGAMTLSCWFSLALLTTKLPLWITLLQSPQHRVSPSPFGKLRLNKAEECGGEREDPAGVSGPGLKPKNSTSGSRAPLVCHASTSWNTHAMGMHTCQHPGKGVQWCWRGQGPHWRWESSIPLSVFTVFKVGAQSTCLSGGWLNEWHNKKWNN